MEDGRPPSSPFSPRSGGGGGGGGCGGCRTLWWLLVLPLVALTMVYSRVRPRTPISPRPGPPAARSFQWKLPCRSSRKTATCCELQMLYLVVPGSQGLPLGPKGPSTAQEKLVHWASSVHYSL